MKKLFPLFTSILIISISVAQTPFNPYKTQDPYTLLASKKGTNFQPATRNEKLVRPFITDDSRVVGDHHTQLESWVRVDKHGFENWILGAYGPNDWLELTIGGVWGYDRGVEEKRLAYALPLIQAKFLFKEYYPNKLPGIGAVVGTFLPYGQGTVKPEGYGTFGFVTISQSFGEGDQVLLHLNGGGNYLHVANEDELIGTWGFGTQIHTRKGFHLVAEIFSGDPYVPGSGISYQVGFRHFFSDLFQIDMTYGKGISGENILDP
ncbi:MAG: hypothetical protein KF687_09435 [Cyclobacteriaceae bacterium]|nr:hypothetical protein [Cyclobacteriaceae bacterium]